MIPAEWMLLVAERSSTGAWLGVRSDGALTALEQEVRNALDWVPGIVIRGYSIIGHVRPMADDSRVGNHSSSEMPDLTSDLDRKSGTLLSGSWESLSGEIQLSDMDAPMLDNSGVGNQLPSEMTDLAGVFDMMSGDIHFSDMYAQMPDDSGVGNHSSSDRPRR